MYRPTEQVLHEFIRESNAIERYTPESVKQAFGLEYEASPFWTSHVRAAEMVLEYAAERQVPDIRAVHSILMHDIPDVDPNSLANEEIGTWRTYDVMIGGLGGERTPKPYTIPRLIEAWEKAAAKAIVAAHGLPAHLRADMCYQFHHWFECIHPFVDGNGRTGRLLWNALRVKCGLDWATVYADKKQAYYDDISRWRRERWDSLKYHSLQREDDQIHLYVKGEGDGV